MARGSGNNWRILNVSFRAMPCNSSVAVSNSRLRDGQSRALAESGLVLKLKWLTRLGLSSIHAKK